jgi:hypothetical protein
LGPMDLSRCNRLSHRTLRCTSRWNRPTHRVLRRTFTNRPGIAHWIAWCTRPNRSVRQDHRWLLGPEPNLTERATTTLHVRSRSQTGGHQPPCGTGSPGLVPIFIAILQTSVSPKTKLSSLSVMAI